MIANGGNIAAGYMKEDGAQRSLRRSDKADRRHRGADRRGGPRRRRRQGQRPMGVRERHHTLRLGLGRLRGDGKRSAAHDSSRTGDHLRVDARERGQDSRYVVRERAVRNAAATTSRKRCLCPRKQNLSLLDPAGHRPEPLYQMPPLTLFVAQLVCVSLGIARSALDELTETRANESALALSDCSR